MSDTLILNADAMPIGFMPLSTLTWEESVKLMFLERVDVIASYEHWAVHSPSMTLPVPSVMILHDYVKMARNIKFSRENVLLRDNYKCQFCGLDATHNHSLLTMDHVVPRFNGGKTNWLNIVSACSPCNLEKAHFTKMKPKRAPYKPTYFELVGKAKEFPIIIPDAAWKDFLDWGSGEIQVRVPKQNRPAQ